MVSTDNRILKTSDKYANKIHEEFGSYADFDKIDDMKTNIFFLTEKECIGEHEDLLYSAGKCNITDGNIYIRDKDIIPERLLVHEYIHRISRNYINNIWHMGIQTEDDGIRISLNEAITEYFCWKLVKYDENEPRTIYMNGLDCIEKLSNKIGYEVLKDIYFNNKITSLVLLFDDFNEVCNGFRDIFDESILDNGNDRNIAIQILTYSKQYILSTMDYLN